MRQNSADTPPCAEFLGHRRRRCINDATCASVINEECKIISSRQTSEAVNPHPYWGVDVRRGWTSNHFDVHETQMRTRARQIDWQRAPLQRHCQALEEGPR